MSLMQKERILPQNLIAEVGKVFVDLSYFDKEKLKKEESDRAVSFGRNVKCPRCGAMDICRLTANALSPLMIDYLKILQLKTLTTATFT